MSEIGNCDGATDQTSTTSATQDGNAAVLLDHWRKTQIETTRRLGDSSRQISLAGLAAVWALKQEVSGALTLDPILKVATAFFVMTLLLDVVHGALFWQISLANVRRLGRGASTSGLIEALNKPIVSQGFLWSRISTLVIGLVLVLWHVAAVLR